MKSRGPARAKAEQEMSLDPEELGLQTRRNRGGSQVMEGEAGGQLRLGHQAIIMGAKQRSFSLATLTTELVISSCKFWNERSFVGLQTGCVPLPLGRS